ncbi:MAG: tetratricopeptide repeat protein [Cyclobacteriaceae bacterium]|tara:strand:+ start:180 stop:506 length:327 start_codon:yes stop_codon:yes gene_type:complete
MGNEERIKQLELFHREDPDDPFIIYALATEHLQINKHKSKELFDLLLSKHPKYIGTYYHAAALYSELGDLQKAEQIYQAGIDMAESLNDHHALKELKSAYLNFQFENE